MANKEKIVSKRLAKHNFTTVGLVLIVYSLIVLIIPTVLNELFVVTNSSFLNDDILYYGIYFIIILVGSFVPFFLLKNLARIKTKKIFRPINASFSELFVQTIVFFAICTALIYVSNMVFNIFGYEASLLSSIGLNYQESNLMHPIYIFMLIVVTPIVEEYAFRGVLLNCLGRYGKSFALYASAFFFALAHSTISEFLPALAMGIFLGKTSLRYKSIQPTIVIHILFNAFLFGLCVLPANVAKYMSYGLALICIIAIYLVLTKRYKRITIQKLRSNALTTELFYTRFTVIFAIILMIMHLLLFAFL